MEGLWSYSQDHAEPKVVETWETPWGTLLAQEKKAETKHMPGCTTKGGLSCKRINTTETSFLPCRHFGKYHSPERSGSSEQRWRTLEEGLCDPRPCYSTREGWLHGPCSQHKVKTTWKTALSTPLSSLLCQCTVWAAKADTTAPTFGRTLWSQPTSQEWAEKKDLFHPKQNTGKLPYESYKRLLRHWEHLDGKTWFKIQFPVQSVLGPWLSKYER